jgi:large subunit ribosomal protein L23
MSNLSQIKKPVITEKSTAGAQYNKYVFEVDMKANKKDLKKLVETLYKVKVDKLNALRTKTKPKVFKGVRGVRNQTKRITVTLKKGDTIDLGGAIK